MRTLELRIGGDKFTLVIENISYLTERFGRYWATMNSGDEFELTKAEYDEVVDALSGES